MSYGIKNDTLVELYLECFKDLDNDKEISIPIDSFIVLYVLCYNSECYKSGVKINLIITGESLPDDLITLKLPEKDLPVQYKIASNSDCPQMIANCKVPAIFVPSKRLCLTGLCAVLRFLLKFHNLCCPEQTLIYLLGYQGKYKLIAY